VYSEKFTENPYFGGSRAFKVIDVGTPRKLIGSACYDTQQVCVSATILMQDEPIVAKLNYDFLGGTPLK